MELFCQVHFLILFKLLFHQIIDSMEINLSPHYIFEINYKFRLQVQEFYTEGQGPVFGGINPKKESSVYSH